MAANTDGDWVGAGTFNIQNPTINDSAGYSFVDSKGLFILHAVLLNTGKVLCFSGHIAGNAVPTGQG